MDDMNTETDFNSRSAPKVMVRLNKHCHEGLVTLANQHKRSLNGECIMGLERWLNHQAQTSAILKLIASPMNEIVVKAILADVPMVTDEPGVSSDKVGFMLRYTPYIRERIADITAANNVSAHSVMLTALAWWVNTSRQANALLEASLGTPGAHLAGLLDHTSASAA
ncbi:TPA: hypothetical protein ACP32N_005091 [Pseudomonas aeruginosa]